MKKGGEKKKEGKYMQNQLHLVCLFPMETRLNPTHDKMNTQSSASSVSEHKVTEKPQAAESICPSLSQAGICNNCTDPFFTLYCIMAVQQGGKKGGRADVTRF